LLPEAADAAASFEKIPEILGRGSVNGGRRDGNEFTENREKMIERFGELRVLRGVFFGVPSNFGGGFGVVVIEEKRPAIGRGSKDARIGTENFAIEFVELEITSDIGAERADGMRECRSAKARMKFFGDGAAADHFAAFENQRFESALCEIERGDESVVAAADESYTLTDGHD
jgi:hypothetical protein